MASSVKPFPVAAAIGCRYRGEEYGTIYEGTISNVIERPSGDHSYITFFCNNKPGSFGFHTDWGSWFWSNDNIVVSIPMIGAYTIFDASPPA